MLEFLIDNIFVSLGGQSAYLWVQTVLLLFLYSYEVYFIQRFLKKHEMKLPRSFHFTFRYIDDALSLNNSIFCDFVDRIYPIELEIKDTTDTYMSASHLDLHLEIDSEGQLRTKLYDKRDDFNFPIVNFHLYVATFQQHLYMEYISLRLYDIPEFVFLIIFFFIRENLVSFYTFLGLVGWFYGVYV